MTAVPPRWIGLFGVAFALVSAGSFFLVPLDTASDQSAQSLAEHYSDHRTAILVGCYGATLGTALQLVFFVGLRGLADGSWLSQYLARLGLAAILVEVVTVIVAFSVLAAAAYGEPGPATTRTLSDLAWLLIDLAAGPATAIALSAFAVALWRSRLVGRWVLPFTAFAALAHLVVAATFARSGFLSPEGGLALVVPAIFLTWIAAVGLALTTANRAR
jgi:hypothetical protein